MDVYTNNFKIESVHGGWVKIAFNSHYIYGSYLNDLPIEWLKILYFALKNDLPFCLPINSEDSENVFVSNYDTTYFLKFDGILFISVEIDYKSFALQVYNEICKFKKEWIMWLPESDHYSDKQKQERADLIDFYINKIDSMLVLQKLI